MNATVGQDQQYKKKHKGTAKVFASLSVGKWTCSLTGAAILSAQHPPHSQDKPS
jgi:hypothetical protein